MLFIHSLKQRGKLGSTYLFSIDSTIFRRIKERYNAFRIKVDQVYKTVIFKDKIN